MLGLLADFRGQLLPRGPVGKQRPLGYGLLALHGYLRKQTGEFARRVTQSFRKLQPSSLQERDQFPQSLQRTTRVSTNRQLLATILTGHPSGDELPTIGALNFKLLNPSTAKSAADRKLAPTAERVKGIVDGHFARIAGIILGRPKASPSRNTATGSVFPRASGWNCSSRSARPFSMRTRRASFTATSSQPTSSSRCTTARRSPK